MRFYLSKYYDLSENECFCATTQFETINKCMSLFSLLAIKATFDVTLAISIDLVRQSNLSVKDTQLNVEIGFPLTYLI